MQLVQVPPASAEPIWPRVEGFIKQACDASFGMHSPESTFARIQAHHCQLWIIVGDDKSVPSACTTSIIEFPGGLKSMFVELLGGDDPKEWFAHKQFLEEWAREQGCAAVVFMIPAKWKRGLPDYRRSHIVMRKDL